MHIEVVRPDKLSGHSSQEKCLGGGSQSESDGFVNHIIFLTFRRFYQHIDRLSMNAIYR